MEWLRNMCLRVFLEFVDAENERGKWPRAILVNGFADVASCCER